MPWKARFADDCVLQLSGGLSVTVAQASCAGRAHGQRDGDGSVDPGVTGSTVWDGAVVAAQYLSLEDTWQRLGAQLGRPAGRVVELGAGCGLAGLAVAVSVTSRVKSSPPAVLLTDLAAVVPFLQRNVARNPLAAGVAVAPLVWGDRASTSAALGPGRQADIVLGADLVYRQPNVEPLLAALSQVLRVGGIAVLALDTSHCPEAVADFLARAAETHAVRRVPHSQLAAGYACEDVAVVELLRMR